MALDKAWEREKKKKVLKGIPKFLGETLSFRDSQFPITTPVQKDLQTKKELIAFITTKNVFGIDFILIKLFYYSSENNFVPSHSVLLEQSSTRQTLTSLS